MGYYVGVDLGTTYTAAAVLRDDQRPEIVMLGSRSAVIPSVALITPDGALVYGEAAERRSGTEPSNVIREFKRRIGDPEPIKRPHGAFSAEALSAGLLAHVLEIVAEREGQPADGLVLTHPANWSQSKRAAFVGAFALLELPPTQMVTEPEAAAISYAARARVAVGDVVAVYDLGGGTFDTAILRRTDESFEIVGQPAGIERLGGIDFDAAVFAHVNRYLDGRPGRLDLADPEAGAALARLRSDTVAAKEALASEADVAIPVYLPDLRSEVRLTRVEFETMIRPALSDTLVSLRRSLALAQVAPSDLKAVLLVGGSSRIPLVAQMVGAELRRPVVIDAHPKHSVALGAALAAGRPATSESAETLTPETLTPETLTPETLAPETLTPETLIPVKRSRWVRAAAALVVAAGVVALATTQLIGSADNEPIVRSATSVLGRPTSSTQTSSTQTSSTKTSSAQTSSTPSTSAQSVVIPATVTADCGDVQAPFSCITSIGVTENGDLEVAYETIGFVPTIGSAPNRHVQFFFPTPSVVEDERNAGMAGPNRSSWIPWDDPLFGPGFGQAGYTLDDAATAGVDQLCILVADSGHVVIPDTGNCVEIPGA